MLLLPTLCLLLLSLFFVARGEEGMISLGVDLDSFDVDVVSPGQCYQLAGTAAERQTNPCSGVVTYSYFVPNGLSPAYFAKKARTALNNTLVMTLPSSCSQSIVALTCAQIYLKCYNNIVMTDPQTYNYYPYETVNKSYPLPFYRPCASVCTVIQTYCANTLYSFVGTMPNCNERYDYSNGKTGPNNQPTRFDASNNQTKCYTPNLVTIAGQKESYLHASDNSFCSGFVDSLFINPGTSLSTNFTVLQLPHVYQSMVYSKLASSTASIPIFLEDECMTALRKFLCYQNMPPAQKVTLRTALSWSGSTLAINQLQIGRPAALNFYIYVPSLPHRDICLDYKSKCAKLIASTTNSNLVPNCTAFVKNRPGVYQFPTANQTMTTVTTSTFGVISFPSSPYEDTYYNSSEYNYATDCPTGFVVPEHPDHENINWIGASGCAVQCEAPVWSDDEWENLLKKQIIIPVVSIVAGLMGIAVCVIFTRDYEKLYLNFVLIGISFVSSLTTLISRTAYSEQRRYCYDNAVPYLQNQGPSPCLIQGVILVYCCLATGATMLTMVIHHVLVGQQQFSVIRHPAYYASQAAFILLIPIIFVCVLASKDGYGFGRTTPMCYVVPPAYDDRGLDAKFTALPLLVAGCIDYGILFSYRILACIFPVSKVEQLEKEEEVVAKREDDEEGYEKISRHSSEDDGSVKAVGVRKESSHTITTALSNITSSVEMVAYERVLGVDNENRGDESQEEGKQKDQEEQEGVVSLAADKERENGEANDLETALPVDGIFSQSGKNLALPKAQDLIFPLGPHFHFYFVIYLFIALHIPYIANRMSAVVQREDFIDAFSDWTRCVFSNYNGDDESWRSVCGGHTHDRPRWGMTMYMTIVLAGTNFLVVPITVLLIALGW